MIKYIRQKQAMEESKKFDTIESGHDYWWNHVGSGMRPLENQDMEQHAFRVSQSFAEFLEKYFDGKEKEVKK